MKDIEFTLEGIDTRELEIKDVKEILIHSNKSVEDDNETGIAILELLK